MDKIWDRKVGGHWPLWLGWKKTFWPRRTDKSRTLKKHQTTKTHLFYSHFLLDINRIYSCKVHMVDFAIMTQYFVPYAHDTIIHMPKHSISFLQPSWNKTMSPNMYNFKQLYIQSWGQRVWLLEVSNSSNK